MTHYILAYPSTLRTYDSIDQAAAARSKEQRGQKMHVVQVQLTRVLLPEYPQPDPTPPEPEEEGA